MTDRGIKSRHNLIERFRGGKSKSLDLDFVYHLEPPCELQNVIERAVILCEGETFSVDETWLRRELSVARSRPSTLNRVLARQEKEIIEAALAEGYGRISGPSGAAAKLGLP